MKAKLCVAVSMAAVVAWSVAHQQGARRPQGDSWLAFERGTHRFASWAQVALGQASKQGSRLALDLGRNAREQARDLPALLAPGKPPASAQIALYEKQLCELANRERARRGLPILKISNALAEVARAHSREMAAKGYFEHESPTRALKTPLNRYRARLGKSPRLIAENIYKLEGSGLYKLKPSDFKRAHQGWMKSPGHRANILRTSPAGGPTQIGVGIVVRGASFWATQNFARP